ncbi:hypothetical protein [Zhihengliuella flava]|uniref:Cation-transporting ATPase n=1 Tax=Zhihengliuella flava TaxID=1285193 RepID=A0A931DE12_9MICC|nr:hypothetical protein [Zhihengliuella flava]MBG6085080.1 hypothetical protein [Zhihengliuella flava]
MFDKLIRKGKQMAGDYVREQLSQRSAGQGAQPRAGGASGPWSSQPERPQPGVPGGADGQVRQPASSPQGDPVAARGASSEDQAAIAKYKYMLKTAPPEDMERAHREAFERLTPEQRRLLQQELSGELPDAERPATDQPQDLARAATRAEVSRPGFMEKILGGGAGRAGKGGLAAGAMGGLGAGLLGGVAGAFIGTAIAGPLLDGFSGLGEGLSGAAEGLSDGVAGAGEELSAAGEGLMGESEGLLGGLFGGDGGGFGGFGGDGGGFGDFEL